ncbi:MAG: hypothetical protein COB03_03045 [Alteromonas sp.]|nr:MAG: hypothetical protein COB03_03045 [Alteromonas sp.]
MAIDQNNPFADLPDTQSDPFADLPDAQQGESGIMPALGAGVDKLQELGYRAVKGFTDVGVPKEEQTNAIGRTIGQGGSLSKWADEGIQTNIREQQAYTPSVASYKDIDSFSDVGSYVGEMTAQSVPMMAAALNPLGLFAMGGGMSNEAYETQPEDNKQPWRATVSGFGQAGLERLGVESSIGRILGGEGKNVIKRVGQSALTEGITETGQEALAQWGGGKSLDELENLDEAFVGGAAVGGTIRGGTEAGQSAYNRYRGEKPTISEMEETDLTQGINEALETPDPFADIGPAQEQAITGNEVEVIPGETAGDTQPNWQYGQNDMPYRGQMQPYTFDGEYEQYREPPRSVPVGQVLEAPIIDGEFERPRGLPNRADTIIAEDGRPMQQAQEFADNVGEVSNRALPQKDIIFGEDGRNVQVKRNGDPFSGRRAAQLTKEFRQAKEQGLNPQVIEVNGGYGWVSENSNVGLDTGSIEQPSDQQVGSAGTSLPRDVRGDNGGRLRESANGAIGTGDAENTSLAARRDTNDNPLNPHEKVVIEAPLSELKLSDDIPQFKSGADQDGVVEPLTGKYDPVGMAPIQVWVRSNGDKEIITGRHRFDLAKRAGVDNIPAQYHYEDEGFTAEDGKRTDAILNIREDKGQVEDYVELFQQDKLTEEDAKELGLLDRAIGRTAYRIASSATRETVEAQRSGRITGQAAERIAETAPKDEALQSLALKALMNDQRSITYAENLIRAVKSMRKDSGQEQQTGDLFGFDDSAMREAEEMAKVAATKQRELRTRLNAIRGAAKNPKLAKAEGVNVKDPKSLNKRIEEISTQAKAWDSWETKPELVSEIRNEIGASPLDTKPQEQVEVEQPESIADESQNDMFGGELETVSPEHTGQAGTESEVSNVSTVNPETQKKQVEAYRKGLLSRIKYLKSDTDFDNVIQEVKQDKTSSVDFIREVEAAANARKAQLAEPTETKKETHGVTVTVPSISKDVEEAYNRTTHLGRGRDFNAELNSAADDILNELNEKGLLDTPERKAKAKELTENYLNEQAQFTRRESIRSQNNPSWIVSGRDNLDTNKYNKRAEKNNKAFTTEVDKLDRMRKRIASSVEAVMNDAQRKQKAQKEADSKKVKDRNEFTRLAGTIAADLTDGRNELAKETRKFANKKMETILDGMSEADAKDLVQSVDKALNKMGGLVKVVGARSNLAKRAKTILEGEQAKPAQSKPNQKTKNLSPTEQRQAFWDKYRNADETITADEARAALDVVIDNEAEMKEHIASHTVAQIKDKFYRGWHDSGMKKDQLVNASYRQMVTEFGFVTSDSGVISITDFGGKSWYESTKEKLKNLTDEQLRENMKARKDKVDEAFNERRQRIEGMSNPQTLEDFRNAARNGLQKDFTPEQWAQYDRLHADERLAEQEARATKQISAVDGEVNYELHESTHSKKGHELFIVSLADRVDRDLYTELNTKSKQLGGYYSAYNKQGAIPGFQFRTEDARSEFLKVLEGESVEKTKVAKDKTASLEELADRIEERANESLGASRKTNTAKRAREAGYAMESVEAELAKAKELRALANAIKDGTAKYLTKLSNGTERDLLASSWNRLRLYADKDLVETKREGGVAGGLKWKEGVTPEQKVRSAEYPLTRMYPDMVKRVASKMAETKGYTMAGKKLLADAEAEMRKQKDGRGDMYIANHKHFGKFKEFIQANSENAYYEEVAKDFNRLQRMGIVSTPMLRAALLEYDAITRSVQPAKRSNKLKKQIELSKFQGQYKENDFFNSTPIVAKQVMELAEIEEGMSVFEPSAGVGSLADAAAEVVGKDNVDTNELANGLREYLTEQGYRPTSADFLTMNPSADYDRIIMNPPFSKGQEARHVAHAYRFLKPGGRLVAVTSSMAGERSNKVDKQFREWLDEIGADETPLPEGAFKEAINSTNVNSKTIVIDKPQDADSDVEPPLFALNAGTVTSNANTSAVSRSNANEIVGRFLKGLSSAGKNYVSVVSSYDDLPSEIKDAAKAQGAEYQVKGVFHKGKVHVVLDQHTSALDMETTLFHEAYGHLGIKNLFGNDITKKLNSLFVANGGLKGLRETAKRHGIKLDKYINGLDGTNMPQEMKNRVLMDELLAHMQQSNKPTVKRLAKEIVGLIRQKLRDLGLAKLAKVSDSDLFYLLKKARAAAKNGPASTDNKAAVFSLNGNNKADLERQGYDTGFPLTHESDGDFDGEIKAKPIPFGMFDGVFTLAGEKGSALNNGGFHHTYYPRKGKVAETSDLDWDKALETTKEEYSYLEGSEIEALTEAAFYDQAQSEYDIDFLSGDDAEVSWEIQNLRGKIAVAQDFDAIEMSDENGTSYFIPFGSKAKYTGKPLQNEDAAMFRTTDDATPFTMPEESWTDNALRFIQDKFNRVKRAQDTVRKAGIDTSDSADVYGIESLYYGKVEEDFRLLAEKYLEPMAEKMAKHNIKQEELDLFLYALHAPERNAHIHSMDEEMTAGSGMTDDEARRIIDAVNRDPRRSVYTELQNSVREMIDERTQQMFEQGLIDEETFSGFQDNYRFYVPLKGQAKDEGGKPQGTGMGFNIKGKESISALGRKSRAESPLLHAYLDTQRAITRGHKNEVGNALLNLIEEAPNPELWSAYTTEGPLERKKGPDGKIKMMPMSKEKMSALSDKPQSEWFATKRDGMSYYIKLDDPVLAMQMKNVGVDNGNRITQVLGSVNRFLSMMATSANPEFLITNVTRDIQTALYNMAAESDVDDGKLKSTDIKSLTKNVLRDMPKALAGIRRALRENRTDTEWSQIFDDFRKAGAKTGYFDMKDIETQSKDLQKLMKLQSKGGLIKHGKAALKFIEDYNSAVENTIRLSVYKNAIDAGISRHQAAVVAKNLTVNFNRKGQAGTWLNSLYLFANAGIQGTANFARAIGTFKTVDGERKLNLAQKAGIAMAGVGFSMALMNRFIAGEDDDGESYWDKVPEYVKERNFVLMLPGSKEYVTFPMPYGYNVFANFGTAAESVISGGEVSDNAGFLVKAVMGSFLPIGLSEGNDALETGVKTIMPQIGKPFIDLATNSNFFGSAIYSEANENYGSKKSDAGSGFKSTNEFYKQVAMGLNKGTGGSEYQSGLIDVHPETVRYMLEYIGSGASRFVLNTAETATRGAQGEFEPSRTPFIRRFYGETTDHGDSNTFYERLDEVETLQAELESLKGKERLEFRKENKALLRLSDDAKRTQKQLKQLRKRLDRFKEKDNKEVVEKIEAQIETAIDRFNLKYNEISG